MDHRAKLFRTGRSQAVLLPPEFRFATEEVYIKRHPVTGDVILSMRPRPWDDFFAEAASPEAADFLKGRTQNSSRTQDLF